MKNGIVEQVEELLKGAVTAEELAEIEKVIQEAKGKFQETEDLGFWEGKTPCWEMCNCPSSLHNECPLIKSVNRHAGRLKAPIVNSMITVPPAAIRASARSAASISDMATVNPSRLKGLERDWFLPSRSTRQINNITETTGSGQKRLTSRYFQPDNGYN